MREIRQIALLHLRLALPRPIGILVLRIQRAGASRAADPSSARGVWLAKGGVQLVRHGIQRRGIGRRVCGICGVGMPSSARSADGVADATSTTLATNLRNRNEVGGARRARERAGAEVMWNGARYEVVLGRGRAVGEGSWVG